MGTRVRTPMQRLRRAHRHIFIFIMTFIVMSLCCPMIVYAADIFKNDVQDVYAEITANVLETNAILNSAFEFCKINPINILKSAGGAASGTAMHISGGAETMAVTIATLLLLVDFFRKSTTFEWSSKWENIFIFLVKVIVIKQVVQNTDVIINSIYAAFSWLNIGALMGFGEKDLLPSGSVVHYQISIPRSLLKDMWEQGVVDGWGKFFTDWGASWVDGADSEVMSYDISWDAVHMFFPTAAELPSTGVIQYTDHLFAYPTGTMFQPTLKIIFMQPYFLVMKAIAYLIFVMAIGRVFELGIYTLLAPLPLATFAGEGTHEIGKGFIKNYIAVVLQLTVMIAMFDVFLAMNSFFTTQAQFAGTPLIQFIVLLALGLGISKSGTWAQKICGAA